MRGFGDLKGTVGRCIFKASFYDIHILHIVHSRLGIYSREAVRLHPFCASHFGSLCSQYVKAGIEIKSSPGGNARRGSANSK